MRRNISRGINALLIMMSVLIFDTSQAIYADSTVIYVNKVASGANDGTSWNDAYATLQNALDYTNTNSNTNYEIWVAAGVYYPNKGSSHVYNAVTETFHISWNNVQLYGGFTATETLRTQRDWRTNFTILSGDIDGNDANTDGNSIAETQNDIQGNNAYHVLYLDGVTNQPITATTIIDGFVITAGNANGNGVNSFGGGLFCDGNGSECSPTLTNITFSGNQATELGGALFSYGYYGISSPVLTNVTFNGNSAITDAGGGMFNMGIGGESSPLLTNVTFSNNSTGGGGGGMYNQAISGVSSPILTNVIFNGNQAGWGGGMANEGTDGVSSPTLTNVIFSGNQASWGGGMVNLSLYVDGESSPLLTNITFSGNSANDGGGMYNLGIFGKSNPTLVNCILWGNTATTGPQIYNEETTVTVVTYSLIQDGCPDGATCGDGMIYTDPQFIVPIDASGAPTTTGNYRLQATSPAIDAGDPATCLDHDLDGLPRPNDGDGDSTTICDMGAYEAGNMLCSVGAGNTYDFPHHSGASIEITDLGDELDCLYMDEMGIDHPYATGTNRSSGIQTGRYWLIRGLKADKMDATGFTANLTLPHDDLNDPKVCRYTGGASYGWDCAATGSDNSTVWRYGITSFSDWAVGQHVGPTVITLHSFGARSRSWAGNLLIALSAVYTLLAHTATQHKFTSILQHRSDDDGQGDKHGEV